MKWQVDEKNIIASGVAGLWKSKLMKCQVDEMSSWWKMSSWWNDKLMKKQVYVEM